MAVGFGSTQYDDLRDFPDAKFQELGPAVDNYVMRYNHAKGGFDLVSADGILIKETETDLPTDFKEVLESEMDLEKLGTIQSPIDGGSFN
jgi:hypothetical protein